MFLIVRSVFWLTVAYMVIKPGVDFADAQVASARAMAAGQQVIAEQIQAIECDSFQCIGGKAIAARNPIQGADRVVRFLLGLRRKNYARARLDPVAVNGGPGFVLRIGDHVSGLHALAARDGQIAAVYIMRNPDKLRGLPG